MADDDCVLEIVFPKLCLYGGVKAVKIFPLHTRGTPISNVAPISSEAPTVCVNVSSFVTSSVKLKDSFTLSSPSRLFTSFVPAATECWLKDPLATSYSTARTSQSLEYFVPEHRHGLRLQVGPPHSWELQVQDLFSTLETSQTASLISSAP